MLYIFSLQNIIISNLQIEKIKYNLLDKSYSHIHEGCLKQPCDLRAMQSFSVATYTIGWVETQKLFKIERKSCTKTSYRSINYFTICARRKP